MWDSQKENVVIKPSWENELLRKDPCLRFKVQKQHSQGGMENPFSDAFQLDL